MRIFMKFHEIFYTEADCEDYVSGRQEEKWEKLY